jgi:hypothetical protein
MALFMIQDRATGYGLPHGGTRAEFTGDKPPRLFTKRSAAGTALRAWRQGHWRLFCEDPEDGALPEPLDSKFNRERAAKRQAMDLAVVEVRLEVVG